MYYTEGFGFIKTYWVYLVVILSYHTINKELIFQSGFSKDTHVSDFVQTKFVYLVLVLILPYSSLLYYKQGNHFSTWFLNRYTSFWFCLDLCVLFRCGSQIILFYAIILPTGNKSFNLLPQQIHKLLVSFRSSRFI